MALEWFSSYLTYCTHRLGQHPLLHFFHAEVYYDVKTWNWMTLNKLILNNGKTKAVTAFSGQGLGLSPSFPGYDYSHIDGAWVPLSDSLQTLVLVVLHLLSLDCEKWHL